MCENARIFEVAKNRRKNRKNVRTTVACGARMILIAKNAPLVYVFLFLLYCTFNIVCLKILPQNERCVTYQYTVSGMCGRNLVGRNHIGTELSMSASQPMKKHDFGR